MIRNICMSSSFALRSPLQILFACMIGSNNPVGPCKHQDSAGRSRPVESQAKFVLYSFIRVSNVDRHGNGRGFQFQTYLP